MPDDLNNRGPRDRSRVNVHEAWERDWWCRKWRITPAQLVNAVNTVGVGAANVARYLGKAL